MIVVTTVVIALSKTCIMITFSSMNIEKFFGFVWTSLIVYFGGEPSETAIDGKKSYKTIVMVSLLGGFFIWEAFNASLTSKLAISHKKMPFNNLESFSDSNWR